MSNFLNITHCQFGTRIIFSKLWRNFISPALSVHVFYIIFLRSKK